MIKSGSRNRTKKLEKIFHRPFAKQEKKTREMRETVGWKLHNGKEMRERMSRWGKKDEEETGSEEIFSLSFSFFLPISFPFS